METVLTDSDKRGIFETSSNAIHTHVHPYCIAVIDTQGDFKDQSKWKIFSGTIISIGQKILIATASHCLNKRANPKNYKILTGQKKLLDASEFPSSTVVHLSPNDFPDVGVLELNPKEFELLHDKRALPLDRIKPIGLGRTDRLSILTGAPSQRVTKSVRNEYGDLCAYIDGYSSRALDSCEWPTVADLQHPFEISNDIIMEYPIGDLHTVDLRTGRNVELPDVNGMSGGGLWDQGFDAGFWTPDQAFLYGIQSSWLPRERYIRATQIIHWLRLVREEYPNLADIVDQQFPDLVR